MTYTVSLDVHKRETQACIANEKGVILVERRFRTTKKSYVRVLSKYADGDAILETVGFHRPVAKWLQDIGLKVHLAHQGKIPASNKKNDKNDALRLLRLFQGSALPEAYLPPEGVQRLRDVARQRIWIGDELRCVKGKLKHDLYKHGHFVTENPLDSKKGREWLENLEFPEIRSGFAFWRFLDAQRQEADERIKLEIANLPEARRLMTIPGVGAYTALVVLAEIGDFRRFPTSDHVASYAGLVPSQHQSGDHDRRGSITKEGSPILRWILVETAHRHVRFCPGSSISIRHQRLLETKKASKATIATARVLLTVMHSMIVKEHDFRVQP